MHIESFMKSRVKRYKSKKMWISVSMIWMKSSAYYTENSDYQVFPDIIGCYNQAT